MRPLIMLLLLGVLTLLLFFTPLGALVSTSATAPTICEIKETETQCSVSNYLGLSDGQLTSVKIDGIKIQNLNSFFEQRGVAYTKCRYSCSGSGYNGITFVTGQVEGSIGDDGCYNTWSKEVGYHGGNAFSTSCSVIFYNEAANMPEITCNNNLLCDGGEDIKCIDCQGGKNIITEPVIPVIQPPIGEVPMEPVETRNLLTDIADFFKTIFAFILIPFIPP